MRDWQARLSKIPVVRVCWCEEGTHKGNVFHKFGDHGGWKMEGANFCKKNRDQSNQWQFPRGKIKKLPVLRFFPEKIGRTFDAGNWKHDMVTLQFWVNRGSNRRVRHFVVNFDTNSLGQNECLGWRVRFFVKIPRDTGQFFSCRSVSEIKTTII